MSKIKEAVGLIAEAENIVVYTGAGMSVESGIPAFATDPDGLWDKYDPYTMATISAFQRDPEGFWKNLEPMARIFVESNPNFGHEALASIEETHVESRGQSMWTLITSNIDGLHKDAGSQHIIEFHGSLNRLKCLSCGVVYEEVASELRIKDFLDGSEASVTCDCGAVLKPDCTLLGEPTPLSAIKAALEAVQAADLLIVVGSSGTMAPANSWPNLLLAAGRNVININPDNNCPATVWLEGGAAGVLERIVEGLEEGVR